MNWLKERLKDIFYDSTNQHLDIGRCLAYCALVSLIGAAIWNMHLGKEIDLSAYGAGLTAVLGGLQVYIYHDRKQNSAD